jgi:hypothetical protein
VNITPDACTVIKQLPAPGGTLQNEVDPPKVLSYRRHQEYYIVQTRKTLSGV